jgi:hypothetical protein
MSLTLSGDPRLLQPGTGILSVSGAGARDGERDDSADGAEAGATEFVVLDDRVPGAMIYVISLEEFTDEMEDYDKSKLLWYAADRVLADEMNQPVRDVEGTIGNEFKHHFGWNSGSEVIVYVRNNYLNHDFEVVLDEGSWVERHLNYGKPQ